MEEEWIIDKTRLEKRKAQFIAASDFLEERGFILSIEQIVLTAKFLFRRDRRSLKERVKT